MDEHGIEKKTLKNKRNEKDVVVTKARGVCMMSIAIQGKANGKSIRVYSLVKPEGV